jgi:hypothetical protein
VEAETQRPHIGEIASREHSLSRLNQGDWCAVFDSVSKIWMDLLFDITTGKTVILLSIFTQENCPDLTCRKVIIFSFIPNSGMKAIWRKYFVPFIGRRIMMTHILSIADKCVKEEFHWQYNPNSTSRYKAENF